ncbi:unnamed protein product [Trichogramma brassicae]|uniref:Uncharacterized protein n=1 Tax=Trichogramma brassicae TaxID=86971 RepID=A0A6H5J482_9HYME|nr:unnamed protein product [Trichogramma brassicae]
MCRCTSIVATAALRLYTISKPAAAARLDWKDGNINRLLGRNSKSRPSQPAGTLTYCHAWDSKYSKYRKIAALALWINKQRREKSREKKGRVRNSGNTSSSNSSISDGGLDEFSGAMIKIEGWSKYVHRSVERNIQFLQDLRFISDSDSASDDERYLRFRAERPTSERLPFERLRSVVVISPGSGLYRRYHEELPCSRHPTKPELCVPPARAPRAESPGLRQPIAPRPRGRSLFPYLRENPPIPLHLHRSIKIRQDSSVTSRVRPEIRTPTRSRDVPAKRHLGLAFLPAIEKPPTPSSLRPSAILRLGPPVAPRNPPEVLTPPTSSDVSVRPSCEPISLQSIGRTPTFKTWTEKTRERNWKRKLTQEQKRKNRETQHHSLEIYHYKARSSIFHSRNVPIDRYKQFYDKLFFPGCYNKMDFCCPNRENIVVVTKKFRLSSSIRSFMIDQTLGHLFQSPGRLIRIHAYIEALSHHREIKRKRERQKRERLYAYTLPHLFLCEAC